MTTLSTFVLIGTVISYDSFLTTIEFQTNPPSNGGPSIAVMPIEAIPCDINVGSTIYVVKYKELEVPTIICKKGENE
tara:strand:+ start:1164 stop:1394 length:231 start_codon:yes stop_codon:yes gene_type:complete